ncbi:MAG: hypothetical protein K2X99_10925 [Gemmatimonadaceae bacterium]|nr:hypothetical protein [Gemmatimonadaceae bacterium]
MAGFSKLYVIGGAGGFAGADGVNPIELMLLVGDSGRRWIEPHYFDASIKPLGKLRVIVPAGPNDPDALLDACIAFCPKYFAACPSLQEVASALADEERLDFEAEPQRIPASWSALREEARPQFATIGIWRADLIRR